MRILEWYKKAKRDRYLKILDERLNTMPELLKRITIKDVFEGRRIEEETKLATKRMNWI